MSMGNSKASNYSFSLEREKKTKLKNKDFLMRLQNPAALPGN